MKNTLLTLTFLSLCNLASAQSSDRRESIILGAGYLNDPDEVYGFAQIKTTFYEDDAFAHNAFLDFLVHQDDATLIFSSGGQIFTEDGDITFYNITANYELEAKLTGGLSAYIGGGAGVEFISLDDSFDINVDSDANFTAQIFLGLRARIDDSILIQAGARRIFRDDFSLLDDQFLTEDSWAFELGVGFQF